MNIIAFNINSIRTREHQLAALVENYKPFAIALQETKVADEAFPHEMVEKYGYKAFIHGQKGHYGVATLLKDQPLEFITGLENQSELLATQRRVVKTLVSCKEKKIWLYNIYFPNGEARNHEKKFPFKMEFYDTLRAEIQAKLKNSEEVLVVGDMNVAPEDIDIGLSPETQKRWLRDGKCSFLPEEREKLQALQACGLTDVFRSLHPLVHKLSWFDYRSKGFEDEPKRGLRIDLFLASKGILEMAVDSGICYTTRAMDRPSDHAPIWLELA